MTDRRPTLPQKQKFDQQPDFFQLLRQQHTNNPYMRFYIQEDKYTYHPFTIKADSQMQLEPHTRNINLPINHSIYNTIIDTLITNKFIYQNSRIMNTLLDSGRQMILGKYVKKHFTWLAFLQREELAMVKKAFYCLKEEDQSVIEYTVLATSNFILKLGINTSKLSCIMTARKYTTRLLSIPTLSILFLQCLMHTLFSSKEIDWSDEEGKSQFIRQLPKITYIKLSQVVNKAELLLLEIGEQVFFTSQTVREVRNLQYLQFYQSQQPPLTPYQKLTQYQHIHLINLAQQYNITAPFGYQLLFLFRTIYFSIIKDFNPDVIIFVEDYDDCKRVIEPEIRALLLSELMENVTGKVFVMREVGRRWEGQSQVIGSVNEHMQATHAKYQFAQDDVIMNKEFLPQSPIDNASLSSNQESSNNNPNMMMDEQLPSQKSLNSSIHRNQPSTSQHNPHYPTTPHHLHRYITHLSASLASHLTPLTQQKLDYQQEQFMAKALIERRDDIDRNRKSNGSIGVVFGQGQMGYLTKLEEVLRDDLAYISLALIQRSAFGEIRTQSHRHVYQQDFIHRVIGGVKRHLQYVEQNQRHTALCTALLTSQHHLHNMLHNLTLPTFTFYKDYYDYIDHIPSNTRYNLDVYNKETDKVERMQYRDGDYVCVWYGKGEVVVVVERGDGVWVLSGVGLGKGEGQSEEGKVWFEVLAWGEAGREGKGIGKGEGQGLVVDNPSYVVTDTYIYKAFGTHKSSSSSSTSSQQHPSRILRANYRQPIPPPTINTKSTNQVPYMIEPSSYNKQSLQKSSIMDVQQQLHQQEPLSTLPTLIWQQFTTCRPSFSTLSIFQLPLLQKHHGWGIYDQSTHNVIFSGGYAPHSQNKVNKFTHIFSQHHHPPHITQTGKTTPQLFMGVKHPKSKIPLFPFIYGIPFLVDGRCFVLNTNGGFECFTNCNKLFLTEVGMGQGQYGVVSQRRLCVNFEGDEDDGRRLAVIATKQFVIHFIVNGYRMKNVYRNICKLQTIEDGVMTLELISRVVEGKEVFELDVQVDREQGEGLQRLGFVVIDVEKVG